MTTVEIAALCAFPEQIGQLVQISFVMPELQVVFLSE
jgi:hypothetical protein